MLGFRASSEDVIELGPDVRQTCLPGHHSPVSGDEIAPPNTRKQHSLPLGAQAASKAAPWLLTPMMTPACFVGPWAGHIQVMNVQTGYRAVLFPCVKGQCGFRVECTFKGNRRPRCVSTADKEAHIQGRDLQKMLLGTEGGPQLCLSL